MDAVEFQVLLVDLETQALGRCAQGVVGVDDEVDAVEGLPHLGGGSPARFRVGAVDLGQQRAQHRRPRRHLDDLHGRAGRHREILQALADLQSHRMALAVALVFRFEVDLQVALPGLAAQVIVTDQAVEIEGRGGPYIGLDVGQFIQIAQLGGGGHEDPFRRLQAGPVRQVGDDLDLGLVVEGQQLDGHRLGGEEHAGGNGDGGGTEQHHLGPAFGPQ